MANASFLFKILTLGIGCAAGQAPLSFWPISLICLIGFFYLLRSLPLTGRIAFQASGTFGFGYFLATLNWIVEPFLVDITAHGWMAPFALLSMAAGMSLIWAVGAVIGHRVYKTILGLALGIGLAEVARGFLFTGFPWGLVGYIWSGTPIAQLGAYMGIYGLTLLTVFLCALSIIPTKRRDRVILMVGVLCIIALGWVVGMNRIVDSDLEHSSKIVRLAQPNASQELKWHPDHSKIFFERLLSQTQAHPKPDLVIWPETALPVAFEFAQNLLDKVTETAPGTPVLLGALRFDGERYFNSILYLNAAGETVSIYDKHHLVPFGEYLPFEDVMSQLGLSGFVEFAGTGFASGTGPKVIDIPEIGKVLPLICYEAVFPQDVSGTTSRPEVMMQLTNDAWFGDFSGPQQHVTMAQMRSIEQGVSLLRVANTGITGLIDPFGRFTERLPLNVAGYIDVTVPKALSPTLYSLLGMWIVAFMGLIFNIICIFCSFSARRVDGTKEYG